MFFFFNDTATTEIYTLSLHDALPISFENANGENPFAVQSALQTVMQRNAGIIRDKSGLETALAELRSEEHTSELQSQSNLVCRLLLEKKKKHTTYMARQSD